MEPGLLVIANVLEQASRSEVLKFFESKLTIIDFLVIGLGLFVLAYQLLVRVTNSSARFLRRARQDPLFLEKTTLKLKFTSTLIEILPLMGILGTVWGLMQALFFLQRLANPTIGDIAIHIAPALSTTFFGLAFAVVNLFLFNYVESYLQELRAWFVVYHREGEGP